MRDYSEKVRKVSDVVNELSFNSEDFCEKFRREHRTLQQNFTRLCITWVKTCARDDFAVDERNRASHIKCKAIVDAMSKDPAWDFLPFI